MDVGAPRSRYMPSDPVFSPSGPAVASSNHASFACMEDRAQYLCVLRTSLGFNELGQVVALFTGDPRAATSVIARKSFLEQEKVKGQTNLAP